ncbi:hypothetical protein ZIOFF_054439 [Zingiber officinale]|uniref:Uncharacterized protein n=1 Tax=Zingiber officinale TaxID=94328 RepID=A0A8J5FKD6_ZINOF|nr:hypothetical protein ZIOFF_054439 [Zingiber officinale]
MLGCDVETDLAPKFNFLHDMGLSEFNAVNVVMRHHIILSLNVQNMFLPKLKVWESLFGSREILLKNLWSCNRLDSLVLKRQPSFFLQKPDSLRALVDGVEGIGIAGGSEMFLSILDVLHKASREKFEAHVKLMNSFGWTYSVWKRG